MFDKQMKMINDKEDFRQALILFDRCQKEKICLTKLLFDQALRASIELKDYQRAFQIEQQLQTSWRKDRFILHRLISLNLNVGNISKALNLFETIEDKSEDIFLNILLGLIKLNRINEAFKIVRQIQSKISNKYLISIIFKICVRINNVDGFHCGMNIYRNLSNQEKEKDQILFNSMLHFLINYGQISLGEQLFSRIKRDKTNVAIMMNGYLNNGKADKSIELFSTVEDFDHVLYSIYFNSCTKMSNEKGYSYGIDLYRRLTEKDQQSKDILNSLSNMFIKYDDLENARTIFQKFAHRDVQAFGSLMNIFNKRNQPMETIKLFQRMKRESIEANEQIFVILIDSCSKIGNISLNQSIVNQIPERFLTNSWIENSLIDMWGKSGRVDLAKIIFDRINQPDQVNYAAMINAFGLNGFALQAVQLYQQIPTSMINNSWINVSVLNACSHSALVNQAQQIFDRIPSKEKTNQIYTTMIDVLSRSNKIEQALTLIDQYQQTNNEYYLPMYMSVLSSARNQSDLSLAEKIFARMEQLFDQTSEGMEAARILLANSYSSNGLFHQAEQIRSKIDQFQRKKKKGISRTFVNNELFEFHAHDHRHPRSKEIYEELDRLTDQLVSNGHQFDSSWITRSLHQGETISSLLSGHSERIALAWNLLQRPVPSPIQIVGNIRMCGDCHKSMKLIAKIRQCSIIIRDAQRIHHFNIDGTCSCLENISQ